MAEGDQLWRRKLSGGGQVAVLQVVRGDGQSLSLPWTMKVPVCPAQAIYVLGVVGKGSPPSPELKKKKKKKKHGCCHTTCTNPWSNYISQKKIDIL